ncbi:MAG: ABC transporter ATP-binding protein [Kangiellaceae bacterium]|nr:ABC transporter ATP-binding protein [Kangiellaceae bacterium]
MSNKYKRLFSIVGLAKPGKGLLTFIACLSIIGAGSSILFPMLTQNLVDSFSNATEIPTNWIIFIAGALALGSIASGINYYLIGKLANRMLVNLRSKVLSKAIYLPVTYFDENNSAEPDSRIVNDTEVINSVMAEHFEPFISGMLTLISSLIILWILDWQLTSVLFATLLVSFLITVPIAAKLSKLSKDFQQQEANFLSFITERLSQIRLIKAATAESQSLHKSKQNLDELYRLGQKEVRIGAVMAPIAGMTIITTLIIILAFGAARVSQGIITMGTLIAFILYLFNIIFPLSNSPTL